MKNVLKIVSLIFCLNALLFAAGNVGKEGVAQYKVTIKKLEMYNSTTSTWIVLSDTASTVDVASVNAGQSIASMVARDAAFTYGTYTKARATIGNNFTIQVCTTIPNASCTNNTINGGGIVNGQLVAGGHTLATAMTGTTAANATPIDMIIDFSAIALPSGATLSGSDVVAEYNLDIAFTVNASSGSPSVSVDFNVDNIFTAVTIGANADLNGGNDNRIEIDFPTVDISIN